MPRIRLIIQYDGTGYVGWQTQPNGVAVQEVIERELRKLTGEKADLHASGRTDSGVHAMAQVAHFDTESRIPPDKFAYALNVDDGKDDMIKITSSGSSSKRIGELAARMLYDLINGNSSLGLPCNAKIVLDPEVVPGCTVRNLNE